MVAEDEAGVERMFDDLQNDMDESIRAACEGGVERSIGRIEFVMPVDTGNAKAAVGVPGPIPASDSSIGGLEGRRDFTAKATGGKPPGRNTAGQFTSGSDGGYESVLWLTGMEYFAAIERKHDVSGIAIASGAEDMIEAFDREYETRTGG